jgi:hypothetical protein
VLKKKHCLLSAMLMTGILAANQSQAATAPELDFRATAGPLSAQLPDGYTLGKGRIIHRDAHTGFKVWSERPLSGQQPGHFVLEGRQDPNRKLRVRLEQKEAQPDTEGGKGIVIRTGNDTAFFSVVVDGNQKVAADQYPVALKVAALLP